MSTRSYLSAFAAGLFLSGYLLYIGYESAALFPGVLSLLFYPALALQDRIVFDGKRLSRSGLLWRLQRLATGQRYTVKPRAIVHVETEALRALRRGPNVTYLYRTSFFGSDVSFSIGTGRGYREMIVSVLPLIPDGCLDVRSLELRDHLRDFSLVNARARAMQIPGSDVLDTGEIFAKTERSVTSEQRVAGRDETKKAEELRNLANQLRANGRLLQALEAFRRAVHIMPANGRLIYEVARCLQSLAAAKRDAKLEHRAQAMLRLAERRSANDTDLLGRLGETYFSFGAWHRAENVFKRAAETGSAGYRIFRGLGELALRDGKIAHAIHHFSRSAEAARHGPLFRWAKSEAEYLRRLNDDEEYMELEISRINLYDTFDSVRSTSIKIFCFGLLVLISGLLGNIGLVTEIGWAVSGVALVIGLVSAILKQTFAARIPFSLLDKD